MLALAGERRSPACTGQNPTFSSRQDATLARKTKLSKIQSQPEVGCGRASRVFRLYLARGAKSARILDSTDSPRAVKGGFSTCENRLVPCARGTCFTHKARVKIGRRSQF